ELRSRVGPCPAILSATISRGPRNPLPMPQVVPCPECGKHLQLPDALAGKSVKCPQCACAFPAPAPKTSCPVCGAGVPDDAFACPDCGYHLDAAATSAGPEAEDKLNVCPNPACGTLNPPAERLCQRCNRALPGAIGHVIAGRYRIDQYLAEGGFGVVY